MPQRRQSPFVRALLAAQMAAARAHVRLHTSLGTRVDIFDIIEHEGIWLMFQPLGKVFGAYEKVGDTAGIIINADHPLSLQRFTAAHEFGHHVLQHGVSLDEAANIELLPLQDDTPPTGRHTLNRTSDWLQPLDEIAAQTFAAHFLMPLPLVNRLLRRMELPLEPGDMSPEQVYHLALELGASYAATVNHLHTLGKIRPEMVKELRAKRPQEIKIALTQGSGPHNSRADTWLLNERDAGRVIYPQVNDELHISLPESPGTGYIWLTDGSGVLDSRAKTSADDHPNEAHLVLADASFEEQSGRSSGPTRGGGTGTRHLVLRVLQPGPYRLRLVRRRPWETPAKSIGLYEVTLQILPKQQGLSEHQKPLIALVA